MPKRDTFYAQIKTGFYVKVKMVKTSVTAIADALGYTETKPTGANAVIADGSNQEKKVSNGLIPLAIYYGGDADDERKQRAIVFCVPSKADTIFQDLKGKNYRGKQIKEVTAVRRRRLTVI